jgi:hypothetical protein
MVVSVQVAVDAGTVYVDDGVFDDKLSEGMMV